MDKEIKFTEKKIDQTWKDQADSEKDRVAKPGSPSSGAAAKEIPTSQVFMSLLTSLGFQAMMHLGEIPNPETKQTSVNLEGAREVIELLVQLKEKTKGNLSLEELDFFNSFLPEIQLKFAQHV